MTYSEMERELNEIPKFGAKASLSNLSAYLELANHPERNLRVIHIAGTNGKGSVSAYIDSILRQAGYTTALFTSPHLIKINERFRINFKECSDEEIINAWCSVKDYMVKGEEKGLQSLTFFEMLFFMGMLIFSQKAVDYCILETGLGGRLDATVLSNPVLSVITSISYDHTEILGDTIEQIAAEKAGIIKPGIPVVIGTRDKTYDFVFEQKAQTCETPIEFASDNWTTTINIDGSFQLTRKNGWHFDHLTSELKGLYQRKNIPTVLETIPVLQQAGLKISDQQVRQGIERVVTNTGLFGRWQTLSNQPLTICDTGHNIDGLTEITQQLKQCRYRKLHFVIGMVSDKDIDSVLHILPQDAVYYFCKASIPRAMPEQQLAQKARQAGLQGEYYPTVAAAYEAARQAASSEDMIYIGGSTFVVAEVI